jgi:catalase
MAKKTLTISQGIPVADNHTKVMLLLDQKKKTPVFIWFSTVVGAPG